MAKPSKYVLTLWTKEIDPSDSGDRTFSVLREFLDLPTAQAYLNANMDRWIAEQLHQHADWHLIEQSQSRLPLPGIFGIKDPATVADCRSFRIGDGTYLNSIYSDFVLIELQPGVAFDENLFDPSTTWYLVPPYFERMRKK